MVKVEKETIRIRGYIYISTGKAQYHIMQKRILLFIVFGVVCLLLTASACSTKQAVTPAVMATPVPTSKTTPTPVPVSVLLADALKYYEAGDYEEAILTYTAVIEIEPKNLDAHLGLGKTYRKTGDTAKATAALQTALDMEQGNMDAMFELGCAYLDGGQYDEALALAEPQWNEGQGEAQAGLLLLLCMAAQGESEEIQRIVADGKVRQHLQGLPSAYIGSYNETGERDGKGVAWYPCCFIYVGDYVNGAREGQGIWYSILSPQYYIGEWKNDAPNGYGELHQGSWCAGAANMDGQSLVPSGHIRKGNYVNGLEDGERIEVSSGCGQTSEYTYMVSEGNIHVLGTSELSGYGIISPDGLSHSEAYKKWGVIPWGEF